MNKKIIIFICTLILIFVSLFIYFAISKQTNKSSIDNVENNNNSVINDDTNENDNSNNTNENNDNSNNNETENDLLPDTYAINDVNFIADNTTHIVIGKIKNTSNSKVSVSKINIIITSNNEQYSTASCDLNITLESNETYEFHQNIDLPKDGKFVANYYAIGQISNS